jgi:hypothetical protein
VTDLPLPTTNPVDLIALPALAPAELATPSSAADGGAPADAIDINDPTRPMFGGPITP